MSDLHTFTFPTLIRFGPGARRLLASGLQNRGAKRPVIVTDEGLAKLPLTEELANDLRKAGLDPFVFGGVAGNPVESQVKAGVQAFHGHSGDAIIALGGGASVDVAKAIALMAHHPGRLFEYEEALGDQARPVDQDVPVLVAVPTTAGTGSEVGRSTVISEDDTHKKRIMFSPKLLPVEVFADPELLIGLPASVTAATGMDALTHCAEARLAKGFHPMCDGIALEGLRLIAKSLKDCVDFARHGVGATPEHIRARGLMLNASMMGAVAFQKGLGVTHSLAHALSTVHDLHHGLANGIMLPYAMRFNAEQEADIFVQFAQAVNAPDESPQGFLLWLEELRADIGIPVGLKTHGLKDDRIEELVRWAAEDVCTPLNPRPAGPPELRELYQAAFAR